MKLAVCIVHNRDKGRLTDELLKAGFKFTVIGSTGGFLREGNTTILIGSEEEELPQLKCFATLSPVPGFAKWLEGERGPIGRADLPGP